MVIKISKESDQALKCLCGICEHDAFDNNCLYNKITNAENPGEAMYAHLKKIIGTIVKENQK